MPALLSDRLEHLALGFADKAYEHPTLALAPYLQDHAQTMMEFARQARTNEVNAQSMSTEQAIAIARLVSRSDVTQLAIMRKPFDLPADYIMFVATHADGHAITGGISPEGNVST